jgi:uncharacterized membrane protein
MTPDVIAPVAFFATVFGIFYLFVRKRERLAMLEKGADPSIFEARKLVPSSLKWGLLSIGIGVGILLGKIFANYSCLGEEASFFSMICLSGGVSLVAYHIIERQMLKNSKNNEQ